LRWTRAAVFRTIGGTMELIKLADVVASLLYSLIGILVFCLSFIAVDKLTPYDLWMELVEKKNLALAIVVGGVGLGVCIIIAASIH
jgi:putative membrane protein